MRSQVRIDAILARKAPVGIIFRRGPSKQVLLIRWDLTNDRFECGQWLKGRIYERRCDLSPEGDLLLYFAAQHREPYRSWSAISRPPFLTALALWPKGDCWGGGGHFITSRRIQLDHRPAEMALAPEFSLPSWLTIGAFGNCPGWGEDDPIWAERLKRDGWTLISSPARTKDDRGAKVWLEYDPPITWRKPNPVWPQRYSLEMSIVGMKERNGPWYLVEHSIIREDDHLDKIGRSDWADWGTSGDLLFAMDGYLYRLPGKQGRLAPLEEALQIGDFTGLVFESREAPPEARRWPARKKTPRD